MAQDFAIRYALIYPGLNSRAEMMIRELKMRVIVNTDVDRK